MASPLTLSRVWRILREVDLEAIRREAERHVHLMVIGETPADADALALRLAEGQPDPAPWLTSLDAPLAALDEGRSADPRREALLDVPDIILVVAGGTRVAPALEPVRRRWIARKVPLVTVAVGTGERPGKVRTHGGTARVAVDRLDEEGVGHVIDAVFGVIDPERRLALARQFPALRPRVIGALIDETARTNAGYAFSTGIAEIIPLLDIPLNIGDILVLTKNQLMMSYRIALAAGKQGRPRELLGEIVGVIGGGLLFRQVARQLIGLIPVIGIVPKVAVAYGGTWVIGRAVSYWATEGRKITGRRLKELSREGLARGRGVARALKKRTPAA